MMISLKAKIAFLAMPRAASTSIENVLLPYSDIAFKKFPRFKHINLAIYNIRLRPFLDTNNFTDIETTAIFREPVSWLASWYKYRSDPAIKFRQNSASGLSFNEFVEAYLMDSPPDFAKVGQQSKFVMAKNSTCGIDNLFKFTNLSGFQSFLSERLSTEIVFDHKNESSNIATQLSPDLQRELESRFAVDFDIYDSAF